MIGPTTIVAALFLPRLVLSFPSYSARNSDNIRALRNSPYFIDGKVEIPVAEACDGRLAKLGFDMQEECLGMIQVAKEINARESVVFCSHGGANAKYDPASGLCQMILGNSAQLNERDTWPGKNCEDTIRCYAPFEAHWSPVIGSCVCAIDTYPKLKSQLFRFEPIAEKEILYGPSKTKVKAPTAAEHLDVVKSELEEIVQPFDELRSVAEHMFPNIQLPSFHLPAFQLSKSYRPGAGFKQLGQILTRGLSVFTNYPIQKRSVALSQSTTSNSIHSIPIPTYIPPPNTQVTQELIQESLLLQPQKLAVVGSVIPDFGNGVITFLVQLDGPISQTLALNSSDTLPCDSIGTQPPPFLKLVPKTVKDGVPQTVLATCLVIAVNMYEPDYITYWIQKQDGSIFSLLSDNKIHAIDQLDTSQPASVAIRVSVGKMAKRELAINIIAVERRQIFSIACDASCPFHHMIRITSDDKYCGCMFKSADQHVDVVGRGVEQPNQYTATMTAEACSAMSCINNGGRPALFNPFTANCWCVSPAYVETNDSTYNGGL